MRFAAPVISRLPWSVWRTGKPNDDAGARPVRTAGRRGLQALEFGRGFRGGLARRTDGGLFVAVARGTSGCSAGSRCARRSCADAGCTVVARRSRAGTGDGGVAAAGYNASRRAAGRRAGSEDRRDGGGGPSVARTETGRTEASGKARAQEAGSEEGTQTAGAPHPGQSALRFEDRGAAGRAKPGKRRKPGSHSELARSCGGALAGGETLSE